MNLFEKKVADSLRVKYCVLTGSGTSAIIAVLNTYDFPKGSEIILPSFCCFNPAAAIILSGYRPIFCDVRMDNYTIDVESLRDHITPKTQAIIPVHLYSQSYDYKGVCRLAREHNLVVIDDACQSFGGSTNNEMHGSWGDVGVTSFGDMKVLGLGGGGAILSNDKSMYKNSRKIVEGWRDGKLINNTERLRAIIFDEFARFKKHGYDINAYIPLVFKLFYNFNNGIYNYKMPKRCIEKGLKQIDKFNQIKQKNIENVNLYKKLLSNEMITFPNYQDPTINPLYTCILKEDVKKPFFDKIKKYGVLPSRKCPLPIWGTYYPLERFHGQSSNKNSEKIYSRAFALVCRDISRLQLEYISEKINIVLDEIRTDLS